MIQHCHSCDVRLSCSSDSIPHLETSISCGCSWKNKTKQQTLLFATFQTGSPEHPIYTLFTLQECFPCPISAISSKSSSNVTSYRKLLSNCSCFLIMESLIWRMSLISICHPGPVTGHVSMVRNNGPDESATKSILDYPSGP